MSTISEFTVGKGRTTGNEKTNVWTKKYLEITVKMPEKPTDGDLHEAVTRAEYLIDNWLEEAEAPQIPEFNPELLMKHEGWKARKQSDGSYTAGSLSWGWDFPSCFPKEVIFALERGPITIDQYEFSLNKEKSLVNVKKKGG